MSSIFRAWRDASRVERWAFVLVALTTGGSLIFTAIYPAVGGDADAHLNWLNQFSTLFRLGVHYPRWLPLSNCGFGSPSFYFYPPLPYWCASLFRFFTSFAPSGYYNAVAFIATIGSLFTAAWLLRQYTSNPLRIVTASLLYSFVAYRFADVFVRDALGEHWALTFLPLVFLRHESRLRTIAFIAIGWAGIILSNVPVLVLCMMTVGFVLLIEHDARAIMNQAASFLIAVLIGACFLLPAAALKHLIHVEHLVRSALMGTTGFAVLDLFMFYGPLRVLTSVTLVAGCMFVVSRHPTASERRWWWIALLACALQVPVFWFLWNGPGLREFVQFSWRFDAFVMLAISVMYALTTRKLDHWLIIGLACVTLISILRMSNKVWLHPKLRYDAFRIDSPEYIPKWGPADFHAPEALVRNHADDPPAMLMGLTKSLDVIRLTESSPIGYGFDVRLSKAAPVRFHLFYWPYWKAQSAESAIDLRPDPDGFVTALLPSGSYKLSLTLTKSTEEKVGAVLSWAGLIVLAGLIVAGRRQDASVSSHMTTEPAMDPKNLNWRRAASSDPSE